MQNIWKFIVKNASLQEVGNSGDRQIRSKIWSRLYYPGELTPRGGTRDFKWRARDDRRIFLGLKFSIPGLFWVRKFGKYLFG